jgi:PPOX class probable F420-dependent enzyme
VGSLIPESHADLLSREKKAFAHLAIVTKNGTPHVTPMWFDYDGELIIFNTARGRLKDKTMSQLPAVAVAISDPGNPYRYLQIRGQVVSETEEGGYEQICDLNLKYKSDRNYPRVPGQVRVTYRVRPERVNGMG